MVTLVSPGVDVQIIDESFYVSAGAGTVPLIVIATATNKASPSGTGVAKFTQPANAGKLFLATSQRELVQNFGMPKFYSSQGTSIHGYELNEYGLHAAYQYLGISNRAYVVRADVDTEELEPRVIEPRGAPLAGTYWLDLSETQFGVFQSNGNAISGAAWESQPVLVATKTNVETVSNVAVPKAAFGVDGDFAVVVESHDNLIYEKISGAWYAVNTLAWKSARPTTVRGSINPATVISGSALTINGVTVTFSADSNLSAVVTAINSAAIPSIVASVVTQALVIRNTSGGNISIANQTNTPLATLGIPAGTTKGVEVFRTSDAFYPAGSVLGDVWIKGTKPNGGADWRVKFYSAAVNQFVSLTAPMFPYSSGLADGLANKDAAAFASLGLPTTGNVYVGYDATTNVQVIRRWSGTRWEDLSYEASYLPPSTDPAEGTMWYNPDFRADIMVGSGVHWESYRRRYPATDPNGVIISGSMPASQSTGASLVDNDLWIDSSDIENYPSMFRYDAGKRRWKKIDTTDQTTPFGVVFADARGNSGIEFEGIENADAYEYESEERHDMLVSDWVDPDAPDPRLYPDGMLLFNTRYSTYNVKEWRPYWFQNGTQPSSFADDIDYSQIDYHVGAPTRQFRLDEGKLGRWVTKSGNQIDGKPYMGRKAQRAIIVRAMQAVVNANEDLRSELVYFNLLAAPGYPEMIDELIKLNTDQKEVAFIVADTPARLQPSGSSIEAWAKNPNGVTNGEEGLSAANIYTAVYYPWGLTSNTDGMDIMIPPSTIALHTMAYNDQVSYPWFAPAGFQRGIVTNASSVGYLTSEGEFKAILLNPGQRDTLYENKINPIAFIPGRGLVVFGQKTLSPLSSALDRINVARLANYLKYHLDIAMKPFLFEQNDQQTRDAARLVVEGFLANLVSLRALEDFAVLCNLSNNTPERRDRNELWVDVLIKPLKAIEFIYIPVRVLASGAAIPSSVTG